METYREARDIFIIGTDRNVPKFARSQEDINGTCLSGTDFQQKGASG